MNIAFKEASDKISVIDVHVIMLHKGIAFHDSHMTQKGSAFVGLCLRRCTPVNLLIQKRLLRHCQIHHVYYKCVCVIPCMCLVEAKFC